ncbi:MAG: glycolate oxidase iron-sulfur subunit [Lysobacterales bacterium]|nr:MAG: glycolate oxidase iron-sulfur subunit [Xanthomonadales bacterium]
MQTTLADFIRGTAAGDEAEAILRTCVHCGFCTATCPTYQLLGDELDGPRGRIYLMKQVLEGHKATERTQTHLDRCLTCRSCETTCPSGVRYHHLLDIGRAVVEEQVGRPPLQKFLRWSLRQVLPYPGRFTPLLRIGQAFRGVLPAPLQAKLPPKREAGSWPKSAHARRMYVLDGCVQPGIDANINAATARVLDRLGIRVEVAPRDGCCGAASFHLDAQDEGLVFARRRIDAWYPAIASGEVEAIISTASGCGAFIKDYGHLLRDDPAYAEKAARVSAAAKDLVEILAAEPLENLSLKPGGKTAFHCPCTLQHALKLAGKVEAVLTRLGFPLTAVPDAHLCCGSAGTYSITQPELSKQLRDNKIRALESGAPDRIATANIGCLAHLQTGTQKPVQHWIEVIDAALA